MQNFHQEHLQQQMQPQTPSPCPRRAQLLLLSPAVGSIEFPRCAGRADIGPRSPELVGPSILLQQKPLEEKLGHTKHTTHGTFGTALTGGGAQKSQNSQLFSRWCQSRGIGAFLFFHSLSMVSKYMTSSLKNCGGERVASR